MGQETVFHKAGGSALDPFMPGAGTAAVHWSEKLSKPRGSQGCLGHVWAPNG